MVTVREYREFILMVMDDVDDIIVMKDGKVVSLDENMTYACTVNLLRSQPPDKIIRPLETESENEMEDKSTKLKDYLQPKYYEHRKWEF